ncbi:ankyrin repeat protein [Xylariomycetidae sp. FL2044]|nr:ankyrin repeat protein [Xylariomycetidae sp. FL2044]
MGLDQLVKLPAPHNELVSYIANHPNTSISHLMRPYRKFETHLRELYAQQPNNPILNHHHINVLPLFPDNASIRVQARARDMENESAAEKEKYIMPLPQDKRRPTGSPAIVESLKEFRHNLSVFSESSLSDMDWSNVVAAGSAVVNCLLPVPPEYKKSKKTLRQYYHEKFCPASDVDLFLFGLTEEQAIEKIQDIETRIRDTILSEVTVVRTKNAITICSQYPTRHVQIVLRVYKSVSEILTAFDIDCSGAAYDGKQVYCTPRALASYITQINPIDLSRRSPSYENRLSKYSHRNFEVYWPELDRSRIDPTIFERSFQRTLGLARLLVLERLPTTNAREQYLKKRREERGRPELSQRFQHRLYGNIKDIHEDEVADWVDEDEVSNYHTFTIPYGARFHAKKIEKLCYTRDLLLNAEWNQPEDRTVYLHRHPAFFGRVKDVVGDCCGTCPKPKTVEEIEIAEKESEIYVSGGVKFRIDDPGRQQIGSFNPLTEDDWTEMAYVGNTARLCQAIVDGDIEHVEDWLSQEGADPNQRDYTGRTPLHLAVTSSTPKIVKCLVDHGARLVARVADGRTSLHLAASRGDLEIIRILLEKSNANEEEEDEKDDRRRKTREISLRHSMNQQSRQSGDETDDDSDSEAELIDETTSDDGVQSVVTGSFVKVANNHQSNEISEPLPLDDDQDDPDYYKIDVVAWDSKCSALHLAIIGGHCEVVKLLVQEFGADVLLPVKIGDGTYSNPNAAILTLVLALALPVEKATKMALTLLDLGATSSQADTNGITAFHRYVQSSMPKLVDLLWQNDRRGLKTALNHVAVGLSWNVISPLMTAIDQGDPVLVLKLLEVGTKPEIDFDSWLKGAKFSFDESLRDYECNLKFFRNNVEQPLILAIHSHHPATAIELLDRGADANTITKASHSAIQNQWARRYQKGQSALDVVRKQLRHLRKYAGEKVEFNQSSASRGAANGTYSEPPGSPRGTKEFLHQFQSGTYQHWVVSEDITELTEAYERELERFMKQKETNASMKGLREKREAIEDRLTQLEKVEEALAAKGAKTFKEQYPAIEEPPQSVKVSPPVNDPNPPYEFQFGFNNVKDVTEARKCAYIKLFEAAWNGDLDGIKSLTLAPWGGDAMESPLKVAVSDVKGNNPFSLAFLKGHYEAAKAILEITQAQWSGKNEKQSRFTMKRREDDESDTDSTDEPEIHEEIVDGRLTIDNIGQVATQVKSDTLASTVLNWPVPTFLLRDGDLQVTGSKQNLLSFALVQNDSRLLKLLIDLNMQFTGKNLDEFDEDPEKSYFFPESQFHEAIRLGRTEMLAEAIRRTGAGIPLEHLVKKSGVKMQTKPRYYQGLSVYGKKRADWANAGRNLVVKPTNSQVPPLLTAANTGSLESVEWFIGDAPKRYYLEFGQSKIAKEDPRLRHLNEAPGGFDRAIMKWLGAQNDMVIHCAVTGPPGDGTNRLIEYLIKVCPASLEAKSDQGYTPLFLACLLGQVPFAKTLIAAGADQSVKDKQLNNILHAAVTNHPYAKGLRALLELLDPELRHTMFQERNHLVHGGNTPLHSWLGMAPKYSNLRTAGRQQHHLQTDKADAANLELLRLLLEFSGGAELGILNGAGDTCLHTTVLRHQPLQTRAILGADPRLLWRENAVGRTPGEIAEDIYVNSVVESFEPMVISTRDGASELVNRNPQDFVTDDDDDDDNDGGDGGGEAGIATEGGGGGRGKKLRSRQELTWDVVREYLGKTTGKRRLVSLNEANDVAKRLGEGYVWMRYYGGGGRKGVGFTRVRNHGGRRAAGGDEDDYDDNDDEEQEEKGGEDEKEVDVVGNRYQQVRRLAWRH